MSDGVDRYLDGDLPLEQLPAEARPEAAAWGRLLDSLRVQVPGGPAPAWLEDRVMAQIEALPESGHLSRAVSWLLRPQSMRVPPLATGLLAAAIAALILWPSPPQPSATPGATAASAVVYVQFVLEAPGARSVAVGGDFDSWNGSFGLEDSDGDGVWTGRVAVEPGVHSYMFLVDGTEWVTDPRADRYSDDGFGNRNAVLAVAAPTT